MTFRRLIQFTLLLAIALLTAGGPTAPEAAAQSATAGRLMQVINQLRSEHGLAPFQFNQALIVAAESQAAFNAANGLYGHSGVNGSRPQDRANSAGYVGFVVENVVGGWDLTPEQAVAWWINSPVHFNTLISTRYPEAGTAFAINGRQQHYTLVVGRRSNAPVPPPSQTSVVEAPAFVAPIILSEPAEDGSVTHGVLTGQSLWAIAARYSVTLEQIRLYNNLQEEAFIRPGDALIIQLADGASPPPTPTPPTAHTVREGETLWTIAARYRLPLADLLWLNSLNEESILRPGDELTIRLAEGQEAPPTPTPQTKVQVQNGDSAWVIAARHELSVDELLAYNNLESGAVLQPGDLLWIHPPPTQTPGPTPSNTPTPPAPAAGETISPPPVEPPPEETPQPVAGLATAAPIPVEVTAAPPADPVAAAGGILSEMFNARTIVATFGLTVMAALLLMALRKDR